MHPALVRRGLVAAMLALCATAQREVPARRPRPVVDFDGSRSLAAQVADTPLAPRQAPGASAVIGDPGPRGSAVRFERDRERVLFDQRPGELWARGANYKLCCADGRLRYVPFLASFAPRNYEIAFSLREVTIDARSLAFEGLATAHLDGNTVELERGSLTERYDCAPRTVEQSFVFDTLPERGTLSLKLDVASDLGVRETEEGFEFSNEYGRALYGRATALDANGRSLELHSSLVDGVLEITVPAEFVAQAALPLVVDPVLASFGVEASPVNTFAPDVTFDANGAAVLYCWEEEFSANDHDIWADVYDANGNPLYAGDWLDMTATYWGRPRSANLASTNRFLVVAHIVNSSTGRVEVWGRTRSVTSALLSPQFKITGSANYDVMFPDVGGDPYGTSPSFFCVAYERVYAMNADHDIHARLVTDAGTLATGAFGIDTSINTLDTDLSISKSNGSNAWNLAWQRASPVGGHDIFGARVDWDGVLSSPPFPIAVSPVDHTFPAASSSAESSNLWVCVYEEDFGTDHDIVATGLDAAQIVRTLNLSAYDGPYAYQDQRFPAIDSDGVHFACSYSELYSTSASDYDVYISEVLFNGASMSVIEAHQPVFQTDGAELESQIASVESSKPAQSSHDYVVAWHREPDFYFFGSDDILGASYRGHAGGQVASFCNGSSIVCPCGNGSSTSGGCPNSANASGAVLSWSGQPSTTTDTLQFFVSGMPSNVVCLFFQGGHALNGVQGLPFGDGIRCAGSPMRRLGTSPASAAGAALYPAAGDLPISIKGQIAPSGATVVYQAWYRNPQSFCTASTTNLSNALVVAWTP
ncbi:MAG: hypothetical protein IT454_09295 [Planctomycetes bacterium]|nr:hypothetical protein [Planctomycetota bacterium]